MKRFSIILVLATLSLHSYGKCTNEDMQEHVPGKFEIYQTDREHKYVGNNKPIVFLKDEGELSDSDHLYHISHNKHRTKFCELHIGNDKKDSFALKSKDHLVVKSVEKKNDRVIMNLDHSHLAYLDCKGIKTFGDLRDAVEPYLTFSCKNKFKIESKDLTETAHREPASVK